MGVFWFALLRFLESMLNIDLILVTQPKGVHKRFEELAEHVIYSETLLH